MRHPIAPRPTQSRPKPRSSLEIAANHAETEPEAIPLPREVDRARNCGGDGIGREGGLTWKAGTGTATATAATESRRSHGGGSSESAITSSAQAPAREIRQLKQGEGSPAGELEARESLGYGGRRKKGRRR
ncbi:hypothetical protein NL676_005656 [Syzygium grande]|nr:hypothetical protein NL676_005656 [Syzygium grande]